MQQLTVENTLWLQGTPYQVTTRLHELLKMYGDKPLIEVLKLLQQ